jgi:exonuclease SbcC
MICLKALKLKNFKAHRDKDINFTNKNLILGENGTGKSSIFHGIIYALFGSSALKYIGASRVANLIREFSHESEVTLLFEKNGKTYEVKRILRRDGNSYATLSCDGVVIASSQRLVDKKIKELLNINRENKVLDTLYIPQGELGKFVLQSGTKNLTNLVEKLFDLDYYSTMLEAIKRVLKDLAIEREKLTTSLYQKERDLLKFKNIYKGLSIEDLEKIVNEYNEIYEKYNNLLVAYNKLMALQSNIDFELLSKKSVIEDDVKKLETKLLKVEEELSKIRAEMESLQIKTIDKELIQKDLESLTSLRHQLSEELAKHDIDAIKLEISNLKNLIKIIEDFKSIHNVADEYESLEKEIENLKNKYSVILEKIKEYNQVLQLIKEKKFERCPVCGKLLSSSEISNIYDSKQKELSELETQKEEVYRDLKEKERELYKLKVLYNKYIALRTTLIENGIDLDNLDSELLKKLEELRNKEEIINKHEYLEKVESAINYLLKAKLQDEYKALQDKASYLRREFYSKKSLLERINIMLKNLEDFNRILEESGYKSLDDLELELNKLKEKLESFKGINPREIELYKIHLKEVEDLKEKIQRLKRNYYLLSTLQSVLEKFIANYRKTVAKKLSYTFNYFFKKLYKYPDIREVKLEIKYERQEWKFYVYVLKNIDGKDVWREIKEANLSGGQIKIVDLAFRLSLARILNLNFYTLLLDEPTESLDENVRYSLAELLDSLKEYQIILCTHDELFKDKMEANVILLTR